MSDPLLVNELEDEELRNQFNLLLEAMEDIVTVNPDREEGAYEALNQRIHQKVTDKPILTRIVNEMGESLLTAATSNLNLATSHRVIKCLIQAYPSALLGSPYQVPPIYKIARHPVHCVLLPWIAANYPWVLDHERCPQVVFDLLDMYTQRQRTSCTETTIKDFFVAYPRALTQRHPGNDNILHKILCLHYEYRIECEADLFKWMAEGCPISILLETDSQGYTPLHHACWSLSKHKGRNSNEICKYLIQKCPESVRRLNTGGGLPIHILIQYRSEYQLVRDVVVCLLRAYPESYDARSTNNYPSPPRSIPFIKSIKPHLDEEKELKETAASLKESTSSLTEAVTCSNDELMTSAFAVFDSWAISFINSTEDKLQQISTQLQDLCNEGRESDE